MLILKSPLYPRGINQPFGAKSPIYTAEGMLGHNGIDFFASDGQPIYASHDGLASFQIDGSGGHGVVIISKDKVDLLDGTNSYIKTIYWHLMDGVVHPEYKSFLEDKTPYTAVKQGQIIGFADNTGQSTGTHLHFGLKPVAQGEYSWSWFNTQQQNGYNGCIDPMPYLSTDLSGIPIYPSTEPVYNFQRDLFLGLSGEDVRMLQKYLNSHDFPVATSGVGSVGNETNYFGPKTQAALSLFQTAHGITPSAGYFGRITRQFIAEHL